MSSENVTNAEPWQSLGASARQGYRVNRSTVDVTRGAPAIVPVQLEAQPQNVIFDVHKAAIVIVDMQNDFCSPQGWLAGFGVDVGPLRAPIRPIAAVVSQARRRQIPVVWLNWGVRPDRLNLPPSVMHAFNHDGAGMGLGDARTVELDGRPTTYPVLGKDSWGAAVVDELRPAEGDICIDKHRISGFLDTPLDSILRNLGVRTLFFAGVNADECVLGTLMDANFRGYDTVLLEDCTATSSPAFCLEATLYNARFCLGFTTTSAALVAALG